MTPDATETVTLRPWRWKKRTVTAIRAKLDGSATSMYPEASCIAYTGPNGRLDRHGAERRGGLRDARELRDDEADREPAPGRVQEAAPHLVPVDVGGDP